MHCSFAIFFPLIKFILDPLPATHRTSYFALFINPSPTNTHTKPMICMAQLIVTLKSVLEYGQYT